MCVVYFCARIHAHLDSNKQAALPTTPPFTTTNARDEDMLGGERRVQQLSTPNMGRLRGSPVGGVAGLSPTLGDVLPTPIHAPLLEDVSASFDLSMGPYSQSTLAQGSPAVAGLRTPGGLARGSAATNGDVDMVSSGYGHRGASGYGGAAVALSPPSPPQIEGPLASTELNTPEEVAFAAALASADQGDAFGAIDEYAAVCNARVAALSRAAAAQRGDLDSAASSLLRGTGRTSATDQAVNFLRQERDTWRLLYLLHADGVESGGVK